MNILAIYLNFSAFFKIYSYSSFLFFADPSFFAYPLP